MKISPVLVFGMILLATSPVFALTHMDMAELLAQADLVAVGYVISVDQEVDSTQAQVELVQVLKGRGEAPGGLITIGSGAGKVYIDEAEPELMTRHTSLFFLQKTGETYVCVNQADGQKAIRGEQLYLYQDNAAYSVPLKEYLEALDAAVKTLAGIPQKP